MPDSRDPLARLDTNLSTFPLLIPSTGYIIEPYPISLN